YADFHKGKPITTMTYDFWVGRSGREFDGTRFNLQEIFLSSLTNFLYDDGREPEGEPSFWGLQKKQAIAHWANRIELLAMVEETNDGAFYAVPPSGGAIRPNAGPVAVGTSSYALSDQSIKVRGAANAPRRWCATPAISAFRRRPRRSPPECRRRRWESGSSPRARPAAITTDVALPNPAQTSGGAKSSKLPRLVIGTEHASASAAPVSGA